MNTKTDLDKDSKILIEQLKQGGDLNHLLNIAYKIMGNPIIVFDTSYHLLACTENTVTDDPLWNEIIIYGTFTHDTVNFFNNEQFIDAVAYTDVVTILKSDKLKYDRISSKFFDKDNLHLGNICVIGCYKPIETADFKNAEVICEYLSNEIQNSDYYQKISRVFQETFISQLIEGNFDDKVLIENSTNEIYKDLKENLYIAVVDIIEYDDTLTHLAYFKDLFEQLQTEYKYFIYLNNIVIIISTDSPPLNVKRDLNILNDFFKKNKIYAGLSRVFQNLFEIQKYYKQALNALNYGMNVNLDQHIFLHDNYALEYLLSSINDTINVQDLCNPIIFLIQKYDQKHNTFYYDILYTYLLSGLNSQIASKKMQLCYEEFCTQLEELWKVFEIDNYNGNVLFSIFFSMKLLKCFPD